MSPYYDVVIELFKWFLVCYWTSGVEKWFVIELL